MAPVARSTARQRRGRTRPMAAAESSESWWSCALRSLGMTSVWPSDSGPMSRNAQSCSSSYTFQEGISPERILSKMVGWWSLMAAYCILRPMLPLSDRQPGWDEADSREFIDHGRIFVPDREEQIATVLDLIPEPGDGLLVDLCCGAGPLAAALLERFPRARVLAMDLSPTMLEPVRATLGAYGERLQTRQFDLMDDSWRRFSEPVHAFVSSLAVHHLDGEGKRRLYRDLA